MYCSGMFYFFHGAAGYMSLHWSRRRSNHCLLLIGFLGSWTTCASVEDVKTACPNVVVPAVVLAAWKIVLEVHYVVHDSTGKSVVIKYS